MLLQFGTLSEFSDKLTLDMVQEGGNSVRSKAVWDENDT